MEAAEERTVELPVVAPGDSREDRFRGDIQALRAIAVMAVVLTHLWPGRFAGGYVGVDVFFVISGFLITAHLGRELVRDGRVRLGRFYARRVRRLLPAAFAVILCSLAGAYFLMPYPRWLDNAQELLASALYAENWVLAAKSVDYSAMSDAATLAQHYWSLAVEEQFYLVWPLLLMALFALRKRPACVAGIAVVGAASLAYSAYFTAVEKSQAYFVTPVRVWEFAVGALIASATTRTVLPKVASGLLAGLGLAMILGSVFLFDHTTEFPGVMALIPVLGTGLVILARWESRFWAFPPAQFLGRISYSLYLWHWPLLLLAPFAFKENVDGGVLSFTQRCAVLVVAVVLAHVSKVMVEDRGRTLPLFRGGSGFTFLGMAAGMVAIALVSTGLSWTYDRHVAQAEANLRNEAIRPCYGAAALAPGANCADPFGPAKTVDMGEPNAYFKLASGCTQTSGNTSAHMVRTDRVCDYSKGAPNPTVVWVVGDSHAQQWEAALVDLASANKWILKGAYLDACPFAKVKVKDDQPCMDWGASMVDTVRKDHPAYVFTSAYARIENVDDGSGRPKSDQFAEGFQAYWKPLAAAGSEVVVLGDPPLNDQVRPVGCVADYARDPEMACARPRAAAQPADPLRAAADAAHDPKIKYVDLTDYFCDQRQCYAAVGDVAVYFDVHHLNYVYSRTLRPMLADAVGIPNH
ncbi:acyltransferase family protein [Kutzneria buriramensis]|uniref:acyltransferase family protein n=1 Tax=Kutzneria buriramensis TaxID=1045776 RepID=UPI001FE84514|nr:acyltransferase family protein [Kutzneria buriramensis]